MKNTISNSDDFIDSRDVIERIDELEDASLDEDGNGLDEDETQELEALQKLASDCEGYAADWQYGATLIRDSYFEDYAQDLAEDIGAIDRNASWPLGCIDWEQAARELQMDYSCVDFDGVDYWIR